MHNVLRGDQGFDAKFSAEAGEGRERARDENHTPRLRQQLSKQGGRIEALKGHGMNVVTMMMIIAG